MGALKASLAKVAASDVPVLIHGETGTGKEVLSRQLHALSARAGKPFVKLNCAVVPSELIEAELFGYERGAFTGAFQKKAGLFELADGGTILLDEIGDMDLRLQAKLLHVLQDQEFRRVGGSDSVRVDVRVIAATHRDLMQAIRERTFREDLYYRLNIVTLLLPALRDRKEDIANLASILINRHSSPGMPPLTLTPNLQAAFAAFPWPGNVRQLENVVRKLIVMRDPDLIIRELSMAAGEVADAAEPGDVFAAQEAGRVGIGLTRSLPRESGGGNTGDSGCAQPFPLEPEAGGGAAEHRVQGSLVQDEEAVDRRPGDRNSA